jgi:hypothetical protein
MMNGHRSSGQPRCDVRTKETPAETWELPRSLLGGRLMVGAGPTFIFPTASKDLMSQGTYQLGALFRRWVGHSAPILVRSSGTPDVGTTDFGLSGAHTSQELLFLADVP